MKEVLSTETSLAIMVETVFSVKAMVRGYHTKSWISIVNDKLRCRRESHAFNAAYPLAIAVVKGRHVLL